jgi:hypothetical protein
MKTVFLVIAGVLICVALFAMIETVWTVMNRPATALQRFERASQRFGRSRVYLIGATVWLSRRHLRLVRALCAETHEAWLEDNRYINMDLLKEQKKAAMKIAA